jgi:hypothetical protein
LEEPTDRRIGGQGSEEAIMPDDHPPTLNTTEARQGETSGHMRWVLHLSLGLAVVVIGLVLLFWVF